MMKSRVVNGLSMSGFFDRMWMRWVEGNAKGVSK